MGLNDEPFPFASPVKFADTDDVRKMDASEIRWWACQMVEAIAWLHEQGFAHRYVMITPRLMVGMSSRKTFSLMNPPGFC